MVTIIIVCKIVSGNTLTFIGNFTFLPLKLTAVSSFSLSFCDDFVRPSLTSSLISGDDIMGLGLSNLISYRRSFYIYRRIETDLF